MKKKYPISKHTREYTRDLGIPFTERRYGHLGKQITGSIELAFLRGYQSGYEDCIIGKKSQHYVRRKEEILKDKE